MKLRLFFSTLIMALWALPTTMNAQNYSQLWKQEAAARQKDLPQAQMEVLRRIEAKASQERSYGNLLKAQLLLAQVQSAVAPDSLRPQVERLERAAREAAETDAVLSAVYETVLGRIYKANVLAADDAADRAKAYYASAMEKADLLVKTRDGAMDPFVVTGTDSRIFMHDLLHVVGFEAEAYQTLHQIYQARGNRSAACITALLVARQQRSDFGREVKKSRYVQTLDSLINEYADLVEAGELAIARYEEMENADDATAEDRYNYVNYALSRWGAWPRMNILRNAQTRLTLPSFHVAMGSPAQVPDTPRRVEVLGVTNVGQLTMTVQRLNVDGDTPLNPANNDDYAKLKRLVDPSQPPLTQTRRYVGLPEHKTSRDSLTIPALPVGVYLVEFTTDNSAIKPERTLLHVSNVAVIHQNLADKAVRLVAVDATTGQPLNGCHIRLVSHARYKQEGKTETIQTDKHGEATYHYQDRQPDEIYAYTDRDKAARKTAFGGYFSYYDNDQTVSTTEIFTDRAIYRPGQTVHVSVLTYRNIRHEDLAIEPRQTLTLTLYDANHKVVSEQTVTTDDFGAASADFQLPASGLTGRFTIASSHGNRRTKSISVEEYKRPTFDITFDEVTEKYTAGDTVVVRGTAKTYSGVPVEQAQVAYRVVRRPSLWWRIRTVRDGEKLMKEDTIRIDADGRFEVRVAMEMPDYYDERRPRYYAFDIEATVTDLGGESHTAQTSLPLGDKETALTCDLPEKALRDSLSFIRFNYLNTAGKPIDAEVRFTINGGRELAGKANQPIRLPAFAHSGKYTFKAVCGTDTLEQSVVLFAISDKRPVVETHDWFYLSAHEFPRDGKPVYLQVGSSDKDQHIVYTILSGNSILEQGVIDQSNALTTRQFKYSEDYGNGILLTYAWMKEGTLYTHSERISKPLPEKRLELQWTSFRDRLTPGQREQWTLTVKTPDGTPAKAQLMAAMYDKSLDQLAPHQWFFAPQRYTNLPSTQWIGQTHYEVSLYGEQPMKPLTARPLDWSHIDETTLPFSLGYGLPHVKYRMARGMAAPAMTTMAMADMAVEQSAMKMDAVAATNAAGSAADDIEEAAVEGGLTPATTAQGEASLRENLNETAFFEPALLTADDGSVSISFTLPESVTTWRMLGFAHDQEMNYGHIEGEAVAQKTVMVQPNVPRFLRTADEATITARLFNTSDAEVAGTARLQLIDPANDQTVLDTQQPFNLPANGSASVAFAGITVRESAVLICKVTAVGKDFSDGEQHYLPVLPDKQLVTTTVPFTQNEPGTKTINLKEIFPEGSAQNKLTAEYTNNPAWLMIQALPSVSNPCEKNAIALATALYANSIANHILKQSPAIKNVINLWKQETGQETSLTSNLQKNEELKTMLLNETPWVMDADREADQKAQLINYFDENAVEHRLAQELSQLSALQNPDGSFSWWPGMEGSRYMTTSVVETLVRLNSLVGSQSATNPLVKQGLAYLAKQVHEEVVELKKLEKKGEKNLRPSEAAVTYLYIRALQGNRLAGQEATDEAYLVSLLEKKTTELTIYGKARSALVLAHNQRTQKANEYLQSIREYTVYQEEMGRYFDTPKAFYSWRDYRIPSQVAAIEALKALAPQDKSIGEMQRWLLQEKRTQAWDTPANTVDAVYAFLDGQPDALALVPKGQQALLKVDGKPLDLPQATAGLGYVKAALASNDMGVFTAEKTSEGTSWGAVYAQFVQPVSEVSDAMAGLSVKREILVSQAGRWVPVNGSLQVGDRVKVRLTVTADRDYDFVQVADQRAACMEPVGQRSGYQGGFYLSPRDNATYYYFDMLRKGTQVVETEYYIDRTGNYETGLCTVQCAYSPEFSARAAAQTISVK